ncbi:MAG TPA: RNA polymerase sigma factor [Hellea balneolensis]|uniref:RNA polymerase sigma factor n=1 Tax=Hellea balneolensis TaxID=287478 RepID=A0A7C5R7F4_9PROT|nr:RNA polymerase sigma factor [Hellea balneolensis]
MRDNTDHQFHTLVQDHQGQIRTFLTRLCKNHALADDLAQDTFLRAYQKLGQLKQGESAKAWVFKIAYRTFLDHIRKTNRRRDLHERFDDFPTETTPQKSGVSLDVHEAMNTLSPPERACVMMCLSYGFSHREVATALELPLGTVKSHVNRGKIKLRAFLTAYEKA